MNTKMMVVSLLSLTPVIAAQNEPLINKFRDMSFYKPLSFIQKIFKCGLDRRLPEVTSCWYMESENPLNNHKREFILNENSKGSSYHFFHEIIDGSNNIQYSLIIDRNDTDQVKMTTNIYSVGNKASERLDKLFDSEQFKKTTDFSDSPKLSLFGLPGDVFGIEYKGKYTYCKGSKSKPSFDSHESESYQCVTEMSFVDFVNHFSQK